jgi:hypothetical protein
MIADPTELEELEGILESFKSKKSPDNDGMNTELLKYAPVEIKIRYLIIINICWNMHRIPYEWKRGVICPIFKKGNRQGCNNYRGISLLNIVYKVYTKITAQRLNTINEHVLSEEQCGFHKQPSCSECIFVKEQLIQKRKEFNLPTYTV